MIEISIIKINYSTSLIFIKFMQRWLHFVAPIIRWELKCSKYWFVSIERTFKRRLNRRFTVLNIKWAFLFLNPSYLRQHHYYIIHYINLDSIAIRMNLLSSIRSLKFKDTRKSMDFVNRTKYERRGFVKQEVLANVDWKKMSSTTNV